MVGKDLPPADEVALGIVLLIPATPLLYPARRWSTSVCVGITSSLHGGGMITSDHL